MTALALTVEGKLGAHLDHQQISLAGGSRHMAKEDTKIVAFWILWRHHVHTADCRGCVPNSRAPRTGCGMEEKSAREIMVDDLVCCSWVSLIALVKSGQS